MLRSMSRATTIVALFTCIAACRETSSPGREDTGSVVADAAFDSGPETSPDAPDGAPDADAVVRPTCEAPIVVPPASLGLDPFYAKYLDADGIPIVSSGKASDAAVRVACRIARQMLSFRVDVRTQMVAHHARIAVMARTEVTTDVPEHADLYTAFPGTDWDERARGLGGTVDRPATSCAEENLLCDATDRYVGENILVHELSHGIANLGMTFADKTFMSRLKSAYADAIAAGKWKDTYAGSNADEYFAEGVQSYFETNIESIPPNGIHNEVNTRAELEKYDPKLFAIVAEVFGPEIWTPTCP
jgi:hypothetical protein